MKSNIKILLPLISLIILPVIIGTTSCKKDDENPDPPFRVALLVDDAGIDDKTFNQSTWEGIIQAQEETGFDFIWQEGSSPADYEGIINGFIENGADLVIAPGFNLTNAIAAAADEHPSVNFFLLDDRPDIIPENMSCGLFDVDEAAFLCGFLAAWWAQHKDQDQPVAGWIGGPPIPAIEQFKTGYMNGIIYFNADYRMNVGIAGNYAASFTDTLRTAFLADSLTDAGAEVIFVFAGMAGNAALTRIKALGGQAIGTDADQYLSFPEVKEILLTSCMKNLDTLTHKLLIDYADGTFPGGTTLMGTLSNEGAGLAPFHEYETQIPDSVKMKLNDIGEGIIGGTIDTGWE